MWQQSCETLFFYSYRKGKTSRVSITRKAAASSQTDVMTLKWGNLPVQVSGTGGSWRPFTVNGPSSLTGGTTLLQLIGGSAGSVLVDSVEIQELCP